MRRHSSDGDRAPMTIGGESADGFLVGRAAALADWAHKKEKREFAKLVARLRALRWFRANRARAMANIRRWQAANRGKMNVYNRSWRASNRAAYRDGQRRRKLAALRRRAEAKVYACVICKAEWCRWIPPGSGIGMGARGFPRRICSEACVRDDKRRRRGRP